MQNLISISFFVGDLNIPNTDTTSIEERVNYFINKYESALLKDVLGYDLWKAFTEGLEEVSVDQKWIDLRDGKEYVSLNGRNKKWRGLVETVVAPVEEDLEADPVVQAVAGQYQSFIANYIYYWYQRFNLSQSTGIGEVKTNAENATNADASHKMVTAWNEMVDWIKELIDFLDSDTDSLYPEWLDADRFVICRRFRKINTFNI